MWFISVARIVEIVCSVWFAAVEWVFLGLVEPFLPTSTIGKFVLALSVLFSRTCCFLHKLTQIKTYYVVSVCNKSGWGYIWWPCQAYTSTLRARGERKRKRPIPETETNLQLCFTVIKQSNDTVDKLNISFQSVFFCFFMRKLQRFVNY